MFVITQNEFLALGVVLCLYFKRDLLVQLITRENIDSNLNIKEEVIKLIFRIYIVGVFSKVYFPFTMAWGEYINFREPVIILNPFDGIEVIYQQGGIRNLIYNLGGNLILLMPMGFFISYYFSNIFNTLKRVFISMFLISLFIESTQVVLSLIVPNIRRFFEINDLIFNSIGGVLGWKLYKKLFDVEKSLEVIDFDLKPKRLIEEDKSFDGYKYTNLCVSDYFKIDKCIISSKFNTSSDNDKFSIITCVAGSGLINYKNGNEVISKGDSILIPAQLDNYEIKGDLEILISKPVIHY